MEACSSHGDRAGGVKRNRTAIPVELKQAVCEYAQKHSAESQTAVATWFSQKYNICTSTSTKIHDWKNPRKKG